MSLVGERVTSGILARRAPVAKIGALMLVSIGLLSTRDLTTLLIALAVTLLSAPLFGMTPWRLLHKAWPVLLASASVVVSLALFAADRSGTVLFHFGPIMVTSTVLYNALTLALRLLSISLPSILVFQTTDPTDLADSLIQHTRVSPRFAIGALAAFRLVGYLGDEWQTIRMARRARGMKRAFVSTAFGLLVSSIRRGVRLATAMDARGFDSHVKRSVARPMAWHLADTLLLLLGTALMVAIILAR